MIRNISETNSDSPILLKVMMSITIVCIALITQILAFSQHDYHVIHHRLVSVKNVDSIIYNVVIMNVKPNRTYRAFSGSVGLREDVASLMTTIKAYKFYSNEYRDAAANLNLDLCRALRKDIFGYGTSVLKHSNLTNCPIKKGLYIWNNFNMDDSNLPPHVPIGKYKLIFKTYFNGNFGSLIEWYGELKPIMKWN